MARAETVACAPLNDPRFPFLDPLYVARKTWTLTGWCKVGWITTDSGGKRGGTRLDVRTGDDRLRCRSV